MKKYIILFIAIGFVQIINAQRHNPEKYEESRKKIEQLEKIKLIEELNLSEETAIKLFSRKNVLQNKLFSLQGEKDSLYHVIHRTVKNEGDALPFIERLYKIDYDMIREKEKFMLGLKDILSNIQIGKYNLFEFKFRDELRRMFFKGRRMQEREKK